MKYFKENPYGSDPNLLQKLRFETHQIGRSVFPSAFAKGGGFVASAFAGTKKEAWAAAWRTQASPGSSEHLNNLMKMKAADPNNTRIDDAIAKVSKAKGKSSILGFAGKTIGKGIMFGGMFALPGILAEGDIYDKTRASVAASTGGLAGWSLGAKLGLGIGAVVGGPITGFLGMAIGAFAGGYAGDVGVNKLMKIPDNMVERERKRRQLNWKNDQSAFQTQNAATMRQQSLQAMNRGQMTARSMLGREAVMFHQ
jgi:hypothetical protein